MTTRTVSLLGLGAMGVPMAQALVDGGAAPWLWNRTATKAERFTASPAHIAATPAEAAQEVTITVLAGLEDLREVIHRPDGLLAGWSARQVERPVLVVMGTVPAPAVIALGSELAPFGVTVVDAPVSGGVRGAEQRRLAIMVGAEPTMFSELLPVLEMMGTTIENVGELGAGQAAKTCNQVVVAGTMAALSEAFFLARAEGVDPAALLRLLTGGLANSEILQQKGSNWVEESFEPGGRADYHLKDFAAAEELCEQEGIELPVTRAVAAQFRRLAGMGLGGLDHSGVYRALQETDGPEGAPGDV